MPLIHAFICLMLGIVASAAPLDSSSTNDKCKVAVKADSPSAASVPSPVPSPAAAPSTGQQGAYPFTEVVAFGDDHTDNGNGSYAWCLADRKNCKNNIYGARTWTDGPVAVSYLVDMLGVPLVSDWAVGHSDGGSKAGATIDDEYTESPAGAPSAKTQIANYTQHGDRAHVGETLHFLWIGNNDITLPHVWDPQHFASNMSSRMVERVQELVAAGSKHVFVVNMYPKQITPGAWTYLLDTQKQEDDMGAAISGANAAIAEAMKQFGDAVIYYDVFDFIVKLQKDAASHGFTHASHSEFCDGDGTQAHWDECIATHGSTFFWINYVEMTSPVYKLIAEDMAKTIKAHFGK